MIIRVHRAKIGEGKLDEFKSRVEQIWIPWLKKQDGIRGYYPGVDTKAREFVMVSVWDKLDSLKTIAGEHWQRALVNAEELPLLEEVYIRHYESFGGE